MKLCQIAYNLHAGGMELKDIAKAIDRAPRATSALIAYHRKQAGLKSLTEIKTEWPQARIPCAGDPKGKFKLRAWKASLEANR